MGTRQLLVQTRWKPLADPVFSGALEIPAGGINSYESVYAAITREVREETGLVVTDFRGDVRSKEYADEADRCFAFKPYCCQQQVAGGMPRLGFVFVCRVRPGEPRACPDENRDIRWIDLGELSSLLASHSSEIFVLHRGVLELYLNDNYVDGESSRCARADP